MCWRQHWSAHHFNCLAKWISLKGCDCTGRGFHLLPDKLLHCLRGAKFEVSWCIFLNATSSLISFDAEVWRQPERFKTSMFNPKPKSSILNWNWTDFIFILQHLHCSVACTYSYGKNVCTEPWRTTANMDDLQGIVSHHFSILSLKKKWLGTEFEVNCLLYAGFSFFHINYLIILKALQFHSVQQANLNFIPSLWDKDPCFYSCWQNNFHNCHSISHDSYLVQSVPLLPSNEQVNSNMHIRQVYQRILQQYAAELNATLNHMLVKCGETLLFFRRCLDFSLWQLLCLWSGEV